MRKAAQILVPIVLPYMMWEYTEQGDFKSITPRFKDVPAAVENASRGRREYILSYKTGCAFL